jgi:nucleotide-binding universal stress UspA family protein
MRVRTKAQFELVDRGATAELLAATKQTDNQLARIHGMWGIGQLARKDSRQAAALVPLLKDGDAEIRAQAAKLLGDVRYGAAASAIVPLLRDAAPRARFFAAEALGRDGYRQAFQPIVEMLAANNEEDVYLRHAGALALSRIGPASAIADLATNSNRAVRIAAVVALRRLKDAGVARFLADQDEYIVTEAARAINDALTFLKPASRVVLLVGLVGADGEAKAPETDHMLTHLKRHGVLAEQMRVKTGEGDVGRVLLSTAKELNADLMVMGAFHHSRWREFILGGVTLTMLEEATIPLFMAH